MTSILLTQVSKADPVSTCCFSWAVSLRISTYHKEIFACSFFLCCCRFPISSPLVFFGRITRSWSSSPLTFNTSLQSASVHLRVLFLLHSSRSISRVGSRTIFFQALDFFTLSTSPSFPSFLPRFFRFHRLFLPLLRLLFTHSCRHVVCASPRPFSPAIYPYCLMITSKCKLACMAFFSVSVCSLFTCAAIPLFYSSSSSSCPSVSSPLFPYSSSH